MIEPQWLEEQAIRIIHSDQLAAHGGLDGVRDPGMLASAIARPHHTWAYSRPEPDVARLAAAYAFGISKNHPFVDGNKRTAIVACHTFPRANQWHLVATQPEQVRIVLQLAAGDVNEPEFAAWLRERIVARVG